MENHTLEGELDREKRQQVTPFLNEDIILKILYKLPHKTLLRFCSVSKSWLDMIANPRRPDSCCSFKLKSSPTLLGFFYPKAEGNTLYINWESVSIPEQTLSQLSGCPESCLPLLNTPTYRTLKASSNGYLLCHRSEKYCPNDKDRWLSVVHYFYVLNPLNQQRVDLPEVVKWLPATQVGFECFIDDMAGSSLLPVRFTVVLIDICSNNNRKLPTHGLDVKVFSSDQGQWQEFRLKVSNPPKDDHCVSPLGYFPGVVLQGRLFYQFCDKANSLLVFDQANKTKLWLIELPHDHHRYDYVYDPCYWHDFIHSYDYRALCAFEDSLFYGIQYQDEKIIQVFLYDGDLYDAHGGRWLLMYKVCLRELEYKCIETTKITPSENSLSSVYYKGFHPQNPEIIFFIFLGKLMSYDVKWQDLVVHTADDKHLPIPDYARAEVSRHWIPFE